MAFDLFCLALVVLFAVFGAFRGLLRQIFGVAGFVGGIVLARIFAASFGEAFAKDLGLPVAVATAAMAIALFLAAEIASKLVGNSLHKTLQGGFSKVVDRSGGMIVGACKGILVAWAVASLVALLRPHLKHFETETAARKVELSKSQAIALATEVNLITELRGPRK